MVLLRLLYGNLASTLTNTTDTRTVWARTVSGTGDVYLCGNLNDANAQIFTVTSQCCKVSGFELNGFTGGGATTFYAVDFRGSSTLTEVIIWGAQAEALSYATSYIPTNGSTVTRNADVCNNAGSSDLINSTEGVLYAEISALADDGTGRNLGISDGTTSNRILILYSPNSNELRFFLAGSGGSITVNHTLTEVTEFIKVALKYKAQDFGFYVNGVEVDTNTSNITFSGLDDLSFNNPFGGGTSNFYGNVKSVAVFKEALTDEELAKITSTTQQEVFYEMRDKMLQINADYYEFGDYTTRLKKLF